MNQANSNEDTLSTDNGKSGNEINLSQIKLNVQSNEIQVKISSFKKDIESINKNTTQLYIKCFYKNYKSKIINIKNKSTARFIKASEIFTLKNILINYYNLENHVKMMQFYNQLIMLENIFLIGSNLSCAENMSQYFKRRGISVNLPIDIDYNKRVRRVSKIKKLPINWQETIINSISTKIQYLKEAIIIMSMTGCRPCEIRSIRINLIENNQISVSINNAKLKNTSTKRILIYKLVGLAIELKSVFNDKSANALVFSNINEKQIANLLARTSKKAFPKLNLIVTPYCFRNAIASDAKNSGMPPEDLAKLLGHCSTQTQKFYGRAKYGKSTNPLLPIEILSNNEVHIYQSKYSRNTEINFCKNEIVVSP